MSKNFLIRDFCVLKDKIMAGIRSCLKVKCSKYVYFALFFVVFLDLIIVANIKNLFGWFKH